jgi:hypothetical protein
MRGARESASLYCQIIQRNCRADLTTPFVGANHPEPKYPPTNVMYFIGGLFFIGLYLYQNSK